MKTDDAQVEPNVSAARAPGGETAASPDLEQDSADRRVTTRREDDFFWLERMGDVTGHGSLVVNRQHRIEFSDGRAARLLEIPESAVARGQDFSHLALHLAEIGYFGPGDPRAFQALFKDMLVNQAMRQSNATHTIRATSSTGRQIVIDITYGRDDRFILVIRDQTESFLEEQALRTALKVGESGFWFYNLETREFQFRGGQSLVRAVGVDVTDITPQNLSELFAPDDLKSAIDVYRHCIRSRSAQTHILRFRDRAGDVRWLKAHIKPNVDETNRVRSMICFFTDVTAQLRSQDEIRSAQEKAERALKAKTAFLGRLAHEIRTPMNAVIGMSDALIYHHDDPEINPKLALIQDSAERIVRLVDDTLSHAKLGEQATELNAREASPRKLGERVCALWTEQARKNGTDLTLHVDPDVPAAMIFDDFRLEQCLNNMVSNAVKFTESGQVDVILNTAGVGVNRQLVLAVRDTGIGMNPEQMKQVFEPYKQADRSISGRFGGTGLGMAITKDLVELMGGRISVQSRGGQGSLFVIALPIVLPSEEKVGSDQLVGDLLQTDEVEPSDYSQLRVLIVDDNATNHMVIGSLLQNVVGQIETAMNGEEAIACLQNSGPFDLVLMDIHMPVMDGIEATLAIRSTPSDYAEVPIIALTADPQYQQARLCRNIGMDDALAKPVRLSGLLEGIDRVLNGIRPEDLDAAA